MNQERTIPTEQAIFEAQQLEARNQLAEAETLYKQIIRQQPFAHAAYHGLGIIAFKANRLELAIQYIEKAIAIEAGISLYHRNLGELYRRTGNIPQAIAGGENATRLNPADSEALYNLGLAYADAGQYEKAVNAYQRVIRLNNKHGLAYNNLGSCLEKTGNMKAAEAAYLNAIAINPAHAEAQNNLGAIYSEQGKLDEARTCFRAAIKAQPLFVDPHYNISSLKSYTPDDEHLLSLQQLKAQETRLPLKDKIRLNFALGKALEDSGQHEQAFTAYHAGNTLQHQHLPYNEASDESISTRIKATFTPELFARLRDIGSQDKTPIFIVGMPRSGTTLIEQVLASHGSIYGAGELPHLDKLVTEAGQGQFVTDWINTASPEQLQQRLPQLGNLYVKSVRNECRSDAAHISDKMPANFFYIGLIKLILPNAKIIHAMRDPMDSCLSCYGRLFNNGMAFTYNLETLGRYYVRYIELMRHWHSVLPAGSILDVRYEDTVGDFEQQAKRIIDYLELPWNDSCLEFYNNPRAVKTASVAQVRKPIYGSSVARAERFGDRLQPLLDIVSGYR
jgi:tetratricopeptide (TPR) repeat protein